MVAEHAVAAGVRVRHVKPAHRAGGSGHAIGRLAGRAVPPAAAAEPPAAPAADGLSLLRLLAEYAAVVG